MSSTNMTESETLLDPVLEPESLRFNLQKCDFKNKIWRRFGFQSMDPRTDFRATGFFGLMQFDYFAKYHSDVRERLLILYRLCNSAYK